MPYTIASGGSYCTANTTYVSAGTSGTADCSGSTLTWQSADAAGSGWHYVSVVYRPHYVPAAAPTPPTKEELARGELLSRIWACCQAWGDYDAREVDAVATRLLTEALGAEAFGKLLTVGYIETDSQRYKGMRYRIERCNQGYINGNPRVDVLDAEGHIVDSLCYHLVTNCPPDDRFLGKLLMLQHAEEEVLAVAGHTARGWMGQGNHG